MSEIDRIAPTRRPSDRVVMKQSWRDLTFLHWEIPAEAIATLLPPELTVDTYEGRAFIGLVPFSMRNVRPVGLPRVPLLSHFPETNVRTYVHYQGRDPGVWFFSLDAANPVAVWLARTGFGLNYRWATMDVQREEVDGRIQMRYASVRHRPRGSRPFCRVVSEAVGPVNLAKPGSLEHFLAERYVLYSVRGGHLFSGRVFHTPYPLQAAKCVNVDENLLAASGLIRPDSPPLAHFARGVDVEVFGLKRLV
jgi:uncharacterized protein YqjF (DUF2071 family)